MELFSSDAMLGWNARSLIFQKSQSFILGDIGDHDLQIKAKKVREFLTKDCTVRIFMNNFKECVPAQSFILCACFSHDYGRSAKAAAVLEKLATDLADVGSIRDKPRIKGRRITLILGPSTS